jgi:hypothetical protein
MGEAIEAGGRRVLRDGKDGQHSGPIAVGAQARSSAEDAFAVLPQDMEAVIYLSAEPTG